MVKRTVLAAAGLAIMAFSSTAGAADLSPRMYTKAPVLVDPGINWTGFYVGLNGGYSWGRGDAKAVPGRKVASPLPQL